MDKYKKKVIFFTGYQKIFDPIINIYKKKLFDKKNIKKIYFRNFSDVRKWHPYENYRKLYACRKDLGGGIILTECHEINCIYELFGLPKSVKCFPGRKINNLDVEMSAIIVMKYTKFYAIIELNMMSKKIQRNCEIISNKKTIFLDFNKKSITLINKKKISKIKLRFNDDYNFEKQWKYISNIFKNKKIKKTNYKTFSMIKLLKKIYESKYKNEEIFIK